MRCLALLFLAASFLAGCQTNRSSSATESPGASVADLKPDTNVPPIVTFEALCRTLKDNYPMLELAGWKDEWIPEVRSKITNAPTREAAFELMDELVCRLNDYHTRLSWPDKPASASPAVRLEPVLLSTAPSDHGIFGRMRPPLTAPPLDGITFAVIEADPDSNLEPGDQVMSVNDVPMPQVLAAVWPHSVGCSVAGKLRSAASRMLRGAPGQDVSVGVIRGRGAGKFISMNVQRTKSLNEDAISSRIVDQVPVIRISRWTNEKGDDLAARFDALLEQCRNSPGLIIDVRNNGGGQDTIADRVTGRFLKEPVLSSISLHRVVPGTTFESKILTTAPRGPWRYEGRVAVLTDEGCMSACEHFVSGMIEAGALTCGTPTSGACGLIRSVQLPGGARLNISQTIPIHTGGIPSPQLGIAPHLWAPRILSDVIAGEDTALRAALRWIKSNEPLPPRSQPVSPFSK